MDLQALKERADLRLMIPPTADRRDFGRYVLDVCPLHSDDSPSLLIFKDGWKCMAGCGHGDVFSFFYQAQKLSIPQVARLIQESPKSVQIPQKRREVKKLPQDLGVKLHLNLRQEHFAYYSGRVGLAMQTVQQYHLGFGTFGHMRIGDDFVPRSVPRWTIPTYLNGKLLSIKARRDDRCPQCKRIDTKLSARKVNGKPQLFITCADCGEFLHPDPEYRSKYIYTYGTEKALYNADLLYDWYEGRIAAPKSMKVVFITEGEYKALAICQLGYYAISFGAASYFMEAWAKPFLAADKIFFIGDSDDAGRTAAERVKGFLPQARVIYLPNPPKGDAVDYLLEHTAEEFTAEVNRQIGELSNNPYYEEMVSKWRPGKKAIGIG